MKILITGANGFVGRYLVKTLLKHKHDICAIGLNASDFLEQLGITVYKIDISDSEKLIECMKKEQPDAVVHLAAISNVYKSWDNPVLTAKTNIQGTINVLEALHNVNPKAKFLNVGSSDEYGLAAKRSIPLTEDVLCQPQNPYSISKYCAEQLVLQLGKYYKMHVIHVRPFNHFGPGQSKGFVISDFANQIVNIEKGMQSPIIKVGDLSAYRDFTFVTDVVEAYARLLENDAPDGVYNVCSGKAIKIEEILTMLISLSDTKISVEIDKDKFRPSEIAYFVGNYNKLKRVTGWEPEYDFRSGIKKALNYYRKFKGIFSK